MSVPGVSGQAPLPADLRTAAPARQDAFRASLQFEQVLVQQLAETMLPKQDPAAGAYAGLLPQALADGLASAGGLGLARSITDAVAPEAPR